MIRFLRRTTRPVLRPISRSAVVLLMWSQRYTLALWFRSVRDEFMHQLSRRRTEPRRWKRLLSALWRISSDPRLANTPELRRIALEGDTVTLDASETWHGRYLLDSQLNLTKIPADDPLADPSARPASSVLAS
ncbi:MAG TPA: hypothetical protein VFD53_03815 [Ilumatobacter sp.]|jgi:hypothetical protein|nr:hypothetical protein [Ilumatobacter sp.]